MKMPWLRLTAVPLACAVGFVTARQERRVAAPPSWPDAAEARVPHLVGAITLDGDTDDPGWKGSCLRTGAFVAADGRSPVHPYSQARILWGDGFLYMNLYAADEDIHATGVKDALAPDDDVFEVVFTDDAQERVIDVNALGVASDGIRPRGSNAPLDRTWDSGLKISRDVDGTPNRPGDTDEEWDLEIAIPFESLGLAGRAGERIGLSLHRCDRLRGDSLVCGAWGERPREILVLDDVHPAAAVRR